MTETITIASDALSATISPLGAELVRLADAEGRDLLWDGDPAWWNGRAPILFPIVGTVAGDRYRLAGKSYALPRHGFARRRTFDAIETTADCVTFRLLAHEASRAVYPFDFRLDMRFAIAAASLTMAVEVTNAGAEPMPASFGFHPALRWPLPYGAPRAGHRIRFAEKEVAPARRLDAAGLVDPQPRPNPIAGRDLPLDDALFVEDALILDQPASRSLVYGAPGAPAIGVDFAGMPHLALWSKPGAPFLCIEPWQGHSDPAG